MAVTSNPSAAPEALLDSRNPATGEVLGSVPITPAAGVDAAVDRARAAARAWAAVGFGARKEQLLCWRRALAERSEELAELIHLENGKTHIDAVGEVFGSLSHLHHAAHRAEEVMRERRVSPGLLAHYRARVSHYPLGVVGVIGPWNYPMFTPFGSIAYALAAGNAVVFKPSELTPLVALRFGEIAAEVFDVPDLLTIVTGDASTGAALAGARVDKLSFTGSSATGRKVMAAAAERLTPVLMELGGKDALIVAEDADLDRAAHDAVYGAMANTGQACISVERCFVARGVHDEFLAKVLDEAREVRVGDHLGAMTLPRQLEIVRAHLEDAVAKGATVHLGGAAEIQGNFVPATVLSGVTDDMLIAQEETFGPILPILEVRDAEEGVERANRSVYGLGSAIYGVRRVDELADRIRAGMTSINSVLAFAAMPELPFGGVGDSGFGRIHGDAGLLEFTRTKSTVEERVRLPFNMFSFRGSPAVNRGIEWAAEHVYGSGPLARLRDRLRGL